GSIGSDSVIRRCRFNVRFARRRTWLKTVPQPHALAPCIGQQFGQIVSHKYRFRVRTQPRLWAGAQDVLRAAPCCARDCEDHARPQRIISEEIGICYRRFGAANPARIFLLLSGRGSPGPLPGGVYGGSDQGPTAATDQSVISPPQTSSAASATVEMLPAFRCCRISSTRRR